MNCEKCGEEIGNKIIGDESYPYCPNCNWFTLNSQKARQWKNWEKVLDFKNKQNPKI